MKHNNLKQIIRICEAIEINEKKEIQLHGKVEYSPAPDSYTNVPSGKILFNELYKLIYRKFYIHPCEPLTNTEPTQIELEDNIALLSKANISTIGFDEGWTMENNDENEFLIACKGKYRIELRPGEFLNVPASPTSKKNMLAFMKYFIMHTATKFMTAMKILLCAFILMLVLMAM
jgi:hypothetical protein